MFAATWEEHSFQRRPDIPDDQLNQDREEECSSSDERGDYRHLASPLLSSDQDCNRDENDNDTSIAEQRAQAYAALTAASPTASPVRRSLSTRIPHLARSSPTHRDIVDVSMAVVAAPHPALAHFEGRVAPPPSVLPRRRTTSSNDAPSMAERTATGQRSPLSAISASSPGSHKAPRRTRVQSANAASYSPSLPAAPSPAGSAAAKAAKRGTSYSFRRRSLSAENSLVATRLARAFLSRELGEKALSRKGVSLCASAAARWPADDSEQRDLWTALHDGVLLCR